MNNSVLTIFASLFLVVILVYAGVINNKKQYPSIKKELADTTNILHGKISELDSTNLDLLDTVSILKDSIDYLNSVISNLQLEINKRDTYISKYKRRLEDKNIAYLLLKKEVTKLSKKKNENVAEIVKLESQKKILRKEMEGISTRVDSQKIEIVRLEKEKESYITGVTGLQKIRNIVDNTLVEFQRLIPREKEYGELVKKLKRTDKKWKYTIIEFYIKHKDNKALLDQLFKVKIIDKDTGRPLDFIEGNPKFPSSTAGSKGILVQYDGNMIEVVFQNFDSKKSKDYDLEIYYINDGQELLLKNGTKPLFRNRRFVKL